MNRVLCWWWAPRSHFLKIIIFVKWLIYFITRSFTSPRSKNSLRIISRPETNYQKYQIKTQFFSNFPFSSHGHTTIIISAINKSDTLTSLRQWLIAFRNKVCIFKKRSSGNINWRKDRARRTAKRFMWARTDCAHPGTISSVENMRIPIMIMLYFQPLKIDQSEYHPVLRIPDLKRKF